MSRSHYGAYVVLWIFSLVECKIPEVRVTCIFSEDCVLPCSFTAAGAEAIVNVRWFQQEALVFSSPPVAEAHPNMRLFSDDIAKGNASLVLKKVDTRSRGRYKCVVNNGTQTYVVATVEAPIRAISIDSPRSDQILCSTADVYPAPVVQWKTEPSVTPAVLQPVTRMIPAGSGLFRVESVLKQHNSSLDHEYVCSISSKYGTNTWTASLKLQEMTGFEGQDLVIPCKAPKSLKAFSLVWTFTKANKTSDVLTYDTRSHKSKSLWDQAELEEENAWKGDVSLTLEKPVGSEHSGIYSCVLSESQTRHLIQTRVDITSKQEKSGGFMKYNLWMLGIVAGLIALLVITLVIKRYRSRAKRSHENAQEDAEMQKMNPASEEPQTGSTNVPSSSSS